MLCCLAVIHGDARIILNRKRKRRPPLETLKWVLRGSSYTTYYVSSVHPAVAKIAPYKSRLYTRFLVHTALVALQVLNLFSRYDYVCRICTYYASIALPCFR